MPNRLLTRKEAEELFRSAIKQVAIDHEAFQKLEDQAIGKIGKYRVTVRHVPKYQPRIVDSNA